MNEPWRLTIGYEQAHAQDADRNVSLFAFDQYMREVCYTPDLASGEESVLIERIKRGLYERRQPVPDGWRLQVAAAARARLVEDYQRLVVFLARRYCRLYSHLALDMGDVVDEGNLGLLAVLDRLDEFDTTRPLSHIVGAYIRAAQLQFVTFHRGVVRLPRTCYDYLRGLERAEERLALQLGREPTYHELAGELGVSVQRVCELIERRHHGQWESLEHLFEDTDDEEDFEERMPCVSIFAGVSETEAMSPSGLVASLQQAYASVLSPQEQEILRLRYGLGQETTEVCTHVEIGKRLGVSAQVVQRGEYRARERLCGVLVSCIEGSEVAA